MPIVMMRIRKLFQMFSGVVRMMQSVTAAVVAVRPSSCPGAVSALALVRELRGGELLRDAQSCLVLSVVVPILQWVGCGSSLVSGRRSGDCYQVIK